MGVDPDGLASQAVMAEIIALFDGEAECFYRGTFNRPENRVFRQVLNLTPRQESEFDPNEGWTCIISVDGPAEACMAQPDFIIDHHEQTDGSKIDSDIRLIKEIEHSLTFNGKYYSTSYNIKNQGGTHYGLFFITSNIYGLEKILEVKWKLDSQQGEGFSNQPQQDLFLETEKLELLKNSLLSFLTEERYNNEIYEFILLKSFLPKHANRILRELQNDFKIEIIPKETRKGSFYINNKRHENMINFFF